MADYYCTVTPSKTKLGVYEYDSTTKEWSKYTGNAKIIYTKYDAALTDITSPAFNSRYHMALVWGVLYQLGFNQYKVLFDNELKSARGTKTARTFGVIKQHDF